MAFFELTPQKKKKILQKMQSELIGMQYRFNKQIFTKDNSQPMREVAMSLTNAEAQVAEAIKSL